MSNNLSEYEKYTGDAKQNVVICPNRKFQSQQNVMKKETTSKQLSLLALYIISYEIVKSKKSLNNGEFFKNCALKINAN